MPPICLTLLVHQPVRLKHYSFFDIGNSTSYEDEPRTAEALAQLASGCLLPANHILLKRLKEYGGDFRIALSVSGIVIEQFERYMPEVLDTFKALSDTGHVEFLATPDGHSLASVFSIQEFREQVLLHHERIRSLTGSAPSAFRNTALIYRDDLAREVENLGYQVMLAPGGTGFLGKHSPDRVYCAADCATLKLLVNNATLSDAMTDRFTHANCLETPTPTGFARMIHQAHPSRGGIINLSLPLDPLARHGLDDTGLFAFLDRLPETVLLQKDGAFQTPTQAAAAHRPAASLSSTDFVAEDNHAHDLSPWMGNEMQKDALHALYLLESRVKGCQDHPLLRTWRLLQASDYFHHMSTQRAQAPSPHPQATPYESPYDAYINFMNILTDFSERIPV